MMLLVLLLIMATPICSSWTPPPISMPGCTDHCGDISVPYPFGVGPNCFFNKWFQVICNTTSNSPKLYLANLAWNSSNTFSNVEIMSISTSPISLAATSNDNLLSLTIRAPSISLVGSEMSDPRVFNELTNLDMRNTPFNLMPMVNTLSSIGCGGSAALGDRDNHIIVGCTTFCSNNTNLSKTLLNSSSASSCYGNGCCQASIPTFLDYFSLWFGTLQRSIPSNSSGAITVIDSSSLLRLNNLTSVRPDLSTILQWSFETDSLPTISENAKCIHTQGEGWYCYCKNQYYEGNAMLPLSQGCQVVEQCEQCPDACILVSAGPNITSKYRCPPVVVDDHKNSAVPIALGLGISLGSVTLSIILYGLFLLVKARKEIRRRQVNFKKNGGMLLQQQMATREGAFERSKVFTCEELERATDNFNENRILGRGGQGTVYKGMLLDGTIVAIKKSKNVDASQLGQFINEVVILSQINHRNVVKLFGCCLETEVPLLVYEFVLNDTLYRHIHNPKEDFRITWKMRSQIAIESAEALRYLHSSSSTPIYHRDIKTSNILLDERYRAKIADFGISKTISIDQTHVTTGVQGTFGYIDPQYFQSNQFTDKSDVYSFGVVLLELLSSKKPVYVDRHMDSRSLASEFLLCMQQSRLRDIVDVDVLEETQMEVIEGVADLAKRCLSLNGNLRPTMHEVSMTLQTILAQEIVLGKKDHVYFVDEDFSSISPPPSMIL